MKHLNNLLFLSFFIFSLPQLLLSNNKATPFECQFIKPDALVFDIGACVGTKADLYLKAGAGHVICVDAQPFCYSRLFEKYKNDSRITVVPLGVADCLGTATMAICPEARMLSTLSKEWQTDSRYKQLHGNKWDQLIEIKTITLDHLIMRHGLPYFCKIDVENFEYEVLKGLSQPTAYLCFEFHEETTKNTVLCITKLKELGYDEFNFVLVDNKHLVLPDWVPGEEILDKVQATRQGNRFGEPLCGDIYARCTRLCDLPCDNKKTTRPLSEQNSAESSKEKPFASPNSIITKDNLVFDIGAGIGRRTEQFLALGARVICVEPLEMFTCITQQRYKNRTDVVVLNKAVAAKNGLKTIYYSPYINSLSSFDGNWVTKSRYTKTFKLPFAQTNKEIELVTLDELIATYGQPDYCKLCICNYESEALTGLSTPIPYLSFEFHAEFDDNLIACLTKLRAMGYTMFNVVVGNQSTFALPDWVRFSELGHALRDCFSKQTIRTQMCGELYAYCPTAKPSKGTNA